MSVVVMLHGQALGFAVLTTTWGVFVREREMWLVGMCKTDGTVLVTLTEPDLV